MSAPHLRIASYNLQKCIGLDMRRRPDRSMQVIAALKADIMVLQEADKRLPPRPAALPHEMIASCGLTTVPFGAPGGSLGWHGNAMLIRPGVEILETAHIDLPGLEPRGAIRADLETRIGRLRVIGLHLGLVQRYRLQQISAIYRHISLLEPLPTVWAGDFNQWGGGQALGHHVRGVAFLSPHSSFPAPRPVAALDRLALSPELRALNHGIHNTAPARIASDHLPIWADLLPAEAGPIRHLTPDRASG